MAFWILSVLFILDLFSRANFLEISFLSRFRPLFKYLLNNLKNIYAEPVGSKAPTFSTDSKISMFVRKTGEDFALLCQAQAFPVPLIRYDSLNYNLSQFMSNRTLYS